MRTISEVVIKLIESKPFLSEALQNGVINYSSLARQLRPEVEEAFRKKVKTGAILMALRRHTGIKEVMVSRLLRNCLGSIHDITVRSDLAAYTFRNSDSLFKKHVAFVKKIKLEDDSFFTFARGLFESSYVISKNTGKELLRFFRNEKVVSSDIALSALVIRLPNINTKTIGLYYYILQDIAVNGINIVNLISTSNEFTIIINDEDVDRCFSLVKKLKTV